MTRPPDPPPTGAACGHLLVVPWEALAQPRGGTGTPRTPLCSTPALPALGGRPLLPSGRPHTLTPGRSLICSCSLMTPPLPSMPPSSRIPKPREWGVDNLRCSSWDLGTSLPGLPSQIRRPPQPSGKLLVLLLPLPAAPRPASPDAGVSRMPVSPGPGVLGKSPGSQSHSHPRSQGPQGGLRNLGLLGQASRWPCTQERLLSGFFSALFHPGTENGAHSASLSPDILCVWHVLQAEPRARTARGLPAPGKPEISRGVATFTSYCH